MNENNISRNTLSLSLKKMILGLLACVLVGGIIQFAVSLLLNPIALDSTLKNGITTLVFPIILLITYIQFFQKFEKRKIKELSGKSFGSNLITGLVIGIVLQTLVMSIIYFNDGIEIIYVNSFKTVLPGLFVSLALAIMQEVIFRGIILRLFEENLGSYIALLISAILFGLIHFFTRDSSLLLATTIQGGFLIGAAYIYSKNLWLSIAINFSLSFMQTGVFGNSTLQKTLNSSWLNMKIKGSEYITGGSVGIEDSIQATLLCLVLAIVFIILAERKNKIVEPYWSR